MQQTATLSNELYNLLIAEFGQMLNDNPNEDLTLTIHNPNIKREIKLNYIPPVTDSIENPE